MRFYSAAYCSSKMVPFQPIRDEHWCIQVVRARKRTMEATAAHGAALRKAEMIVQSLRLLGCPPLNAAALAGATARLRGVSESLVTELHAAMFDRPNEKMLFHVLHFLLLELNPQIEQELRFCWPAITPHDKSNFKRLVQSVLQDLEKTGVLPLGSSQASRLNTGYGPRIVDVIWRLSTHVLKMKMTRDYPHASPAQSSHDGVEVLEAIQLMKARIASKKRQLQEQLVAQASVQDEWVRFSTAISARIQEVTTLQQAVYEEQSKLDASIDREMFSEVREVHRTTRLQNTGAAWQAIHEAVKGEAYQSSQRVLDTALQHHGDQPILDGNLLRPQRSFSDRVGRVNLTDVVKNADALVQMTRARLSRQESRLHLSTHDQDRMTTLTRESTSYVATLATTLQQLRDLLIEIKKSNDLAARDLCIEVTAETIRDEPTRSLMLCPPTPADKILQESDLVQSLRKCSMNELSSIAADSVRDLTRRKSMEFPTLQEESSVNRAGQTLPNTKPMDESKVFRRLQYDFEDASGDHMEL